MKMAQVQFSNIEKGVLCHWCGLASSDVAYLFDNLPICQAWRMLARRVHWSLDQRGLGIECDSNFCSQESCLARSFYQVVLVKREVVRSRSWRFWFARAWCVKLSCGSPWLGHELEHNLGVLGSWKPDLFEPFLFNL